MTKKDYKALAKIIKQNSSKSVTNVYDLLPVNVIETDKLINDLCVFLKADNELFNEAKFREACNG